MAADAQILRQYLIALGFQTDEIGQKKFDTGILRTSLSIGGLAKIAAGAALAVTTMTTLFARSMENLYYSSRRAESGAGNLQAYEFAARQAGLGAGSMTKTIESLASALRSDPGLQGLIESFGIPVTGRDKADVAIDLVDALRRMPFYVGSQFASLFGIGPDEYLLLTEGLDKIKEAAALRKQMAKDAGVDADAAARTAVAYQNLFRVLTEKIGLLKDAFAESMLPTATKFVETLIKGVDLVTRYFQKGKGFDQTVDAVKAVPGGVASYWEYTKNFWSKMMQGGALSEYTLGKGKPPVGTAPTAATLADKQKMLSGLESQFGLPAGVLDRIWAKESARGKRMLSPAGAKGDFQFMDPTAKQYGVDVNSFDSSARGAARMMADLMRWSGGDLQKALAGYNWGQGNVNKFGMAKMPAETRDYIQTITGQPVILNSNTTIEVKGNEASDIARRVAGYQDEVLGDAVRNLLGAVR